MPLPPVTTRITRRVKSLFRKSLPPDSYVSRTKPSLFNSTFSLEASSFSCPNSLLRIASFSDSSLDGSDLLPVEIWEQIINILHEDPKALHSCLLTCRSWAPRARYHLYTHVRLPAPRNLSLFLESLRVFPGNARFVRCLSLSSNDFLSRTQEYNHMMVTAVFHLPPALPSLREITVIDLPPNLHNTFPKLLSLFKYTTRLSFESTEFTSFAQFQRHVLAFPRLKRLCLSHTFWRKRKQPILPDRPRNTQAHSKTPALECLQISWRPPLGLGDDHRGAAKDTLNWLLTTPTTSSLTMLSLGPRKTPESSSYLNTFLAACGDSLRTLEIICADGWDQAVPIKKYDLSNNHALRHLCIHIAINKLSDLASFLLNLTTASSSNPSATPSSLRSLSLRVLYPLPAEKNIRLSQWRMVLSALTADRFPLLEQVCVRLVDMYKGTLIFWDGPYGTEWLLSELRACGFSTDCIDSDDVLLW